MTEKTYTKRSNAKRAAVAAGVPADHVVITVHKEADNVRFSWRAQRRADNAKAVANTPATPNPRSLPTPPPVAARHGIKRPRAGGRCAAIWEYLDANPVTTASELRAVAEANGWNLNNASCELYRWRRFTGANRPN